MRNILISIKPEWVEKILNGEKTVEIRKSIPKCELPCKVYIYCTKGNKELRLFNQKVCASFKIPRTKTYSMAQQKSYTKFIGDESQSLNGKVVAEFTLNRYDEIERDLNDWLPKNRYEAVKQQLKDSCLTEEELWKYGKGKTLYAWHIDNLIIYDTPKELGNFEKYGSYKIITDCYKKQRGLCNKGYGMKGNYIGCEKARIKRPPQNYMFVEKIGEQYV